MFQIDVHCCVFWFPCWGGGSDVCALAFARSSQLLQCPGARVRNAVKAIALMRSSSEVRRMLTAPRFLFVRQIRKMNPPCRSLFGVIFFSNMKWNHPYSAICFLISRNLFSRWSWLHIFLKCFLKIKIPTLTAIFQKVVEDETLRILKDLPPESEPNSLLACGLMAVFWAISFSDFVTSGWLSAGAIR